MSLLRREDKAPITQYKAQRTSSKNQVRHEFGLNNTSSTLKLVTAFAREYYKVR